MIWQYLLFLCPFCWQQSHDIFHCMDAVLLFVIFLLLVCMMGWGGGSYVSCLSGISGLSCDSIFPYLMLSSPVRDRFLFGSCRVARRWLVCAACFHRALVMPLGINFVCQFLLCLKKEEKSLILINQTEKLMKPALCYSWMLFLTSAVLKRQTLSLRLIFVYVDFVLYLGRFGQFDFSVALHIIYEKCFRVCL